MKKAIYLAVFIIAISFLFLGCSDQQTEKMSHKVDNKLKVYTTIYPLYDFTVKVGGDKVDVRNLVPPGAEPHEWEPAPRQLADVLDGDVFIYCGAGLEPWIDKALKNINHSNLVVSDASASIELRETSDNEDNHEHGNENKDKYRAERVDPHIWLDPLMAKQIVDNIKEGLAEADPDNRDYYEANATEYKAELDLLHNDYLNSLENAPRKSFVTSHAAFGYLANRYGLKQISIRGISPEVEPTPSRIAEIIKLVKEENINCIFFESMVNPKVSEVIAAEVGAEVMVLNPLGTLTQNEINAGKNYLSVMRENLANLKIALGVENET